MLIHKSIIPNCTEEEAEALHKLAAQYLINKRNLGEILEEFDEIVSENEVKVFMIKV